MPANVLAPSGFQSGRPYDGRAPNWGAPTAFIAYNYATKIANGDPVMLFTDGTIRLYAAAGTTVHGIFRGCKYYDPVTQRLQILPQWPAPSGLLSTQVVEAYVDSDPMTTFRVQVSGGPITQTSVGLNADIAAGTSGVPNANGNSVCALSATTAVTATLPFRIVSVIGYPSLLVSGPAGPNANYDPAGANNWVEVLMNTSDIMTRTGQA